MNTTTWTHSNGMLFDGAVLAAEGVRDPYGHVIVSCMRQLDQYREMEKAFRGALEAIRQLSAHESDRRNDNDATRSGKLEMVSDIATAALNAHPF